MNYILVVNYIKFPVHIDGTINPAANLFSEKQTIVFNKNYIPMSKSCKISMKQANLLLKIWHVESTSNGANALAQSIVMSTRPPASHRVLLAYGHLVYNYKMRIGLADV